MHDSENNRRAAAIYAALEQEAQATVGYGDFQLAATLLAFRAALPVGCALGLYEKLIPAFYGEDE